MTPSITALFTSAVTRAKGKEAHRGVAAAANESAERIRYLELAAIRMRADLAYFVKRCDRGEIRSCATQARFRATLDAIPEIVQSPPRF